MRKRILSILLCLVMVVGLFPTMALAADGSDATTGSGTKRDPYCVSTYAEMKRLLQTRASYYIKVVGMDNDATNDGVPVRVLVAGKDFVSTEPAIDIPSGANHHLEIATKIWFITKEQDGDENIFGRLIDVERGSSLEITGTGSLRVEVNTLVATNAIICNWGGELTIDGSVVLNGIQDFTSNVATRPIYINGGITNIKGGYIYGHNNMKATSDGVTSAIHFGDPLGKGTALNISGGTIRQYNNEINQENENSCALYVDNDTVANAIHLTGGTFEGGMKMKTGKPLSNLLVEGYQFNDMSTNTVFDGSVSKTQKALVVTPAGVDTTIINNVSLSVKKSPNERKTLSDFDCSYSQNDKMVLDNFGVYPGLNSTSKEIKDHNTPYDSSADYTVMYVFKKKDGFSFSSDVEKHVTVSGGEFWKADQMGGKKGLLRVFVNFPSSSNPNRVNEVSMTMNSKGDFKTIEDLKCQSFVPADKLKLVKQMFFAGLKDTANEITNLTTAYQPAADYTGVYVFKLKSGFSFAQDITDLAKKHVTISEGEIYSMDTMTDTDGAMLLRVFVSFEGTDSSIEKVTLNTPTRSEINQAASSVGFMPTSYTPSEKMSYGLKVMVGLNQDETGPSLEDGKFDAKQDYSVLYNLQPKDGFAFAEGFSAKDVTVSNGTVYKVEMSGKDCYVYVNFPAKAAEDPNYVTEAAVQVAAVAGEIPSINGITVTSSNADKIKKALVLWSNTSTPFVAGQEYSTTVYLEPKEGVTFADDMKLTVNGKVVNLAKKDPNGSVQFLVKITAVAPSTGPNYVTEAAVQVAAVAGEIPSINGITVTSSNADKIKKALVLWSNTSTPFVAGQEYSTTVYLEPKEGVTFADDMKLNVNGKVVDLAKKDPNGSVQFLVKITAVDPSTPTNPAKPSISVTGSYTYDGSEKTANVTGYDPATMNITGNTATDAGNYTVRVTSKTGKWADGSTEAVTAKWKIGKATQKAPIGLTGTAPTTEGGSDGKIIVVTDKMEYRMAGANSYTPCSGTEIENLSAGNYFVRYAEDHNHFASSDTVVTVGAGEPLADCTITFNGNGGSGSMGPVTVKARTNYILPACGFTAPANQEFKAWEIGGTEYKAGASYTVNEDTEIKALWENSVITPITYTVTVGNDGNGTGTASPSTAAADTTITLTATPNTGYHFKKWQVVSPTGLVIANNKFTMPAENVEIKAIFEKNTSTGGGGGGGVTTYPITVKSAKHGDVTASHKSAAKGTTVTLTVDPDKGYVLDTLTVLDGKDKELKLTEKKGKFTFTMPAGKVTVKATFKAEQTTGKNPFIDVPAGSYYEDAVIWAVDKGITTGTSATTFNPNGICTRAQAVTFLWRAAGSPAPKTKVMPFADVKAGSYCYDAVLWAVENGITKGTSDTMFSPDATCTRAQIVTFLWRANGSPAVSGNSAFTDVASDAYYAAAVTWAEKNGVTGGIGGGLFGSNNNCTRAQIVTFIYRSVK